jgi:hypothetical protein
MMSPKVDSSSKTYDEVVVVGLIMHVRSLGGSYMKALNDIAALDGKRSTSAFEHQLRAANKMAGDLLAKQSHGDKIVPTDLGRSSGDCPSTPKKRKGRGWSNFEKKIPAKKGGANEGETTVRCYPC